MRAEIELYKGLRRAYFGSLSIAMLLTEALRDKLDVSEAALNSRWLADPADQHPAALQRPAELDGLDRCGRIGGSARLPRLADVRFKVDGQVIHEGKYGMGELMGTELGGCCAASTPTSGTGRSRSATSAPPAPTCALHRAWRARWTSTCGEEARPLPFSVQQVEAPAAEGMDAAALGIDPAALGPVNVLRLRRGPRPHAQTAAAVRAHRGGRLPARPDPAGAGDPERRITQVTHVTPAAGPAPRRCTSPSPLTPSRR